MNDTIIGEGYHRQGGQAHAEVNCLKSVKAADRHRIPDATLYVSLEPCCIIGKTGACSTLILQHGIRTVVVAQRDSTPGVDGASLALLRAAGVTVREYPDFVASMPRNVLALPMAIGTAPYLFRHTLVTTGRPYVTLKFAQSADGFLRPADRKAAYWITNPISRRLVHRWRSSETGIIVGARTVIEDDPSLTTRLWPGPDPVPIIIDPRGRITGQERVFRGPVAPILYTSLAPKSLPKNSEATVVIIPADLKLATIEFILRDLAKRRLANVTVEGGAGLLNAFIRHDLWDEARVFTGPNALGDGLAAPEIHHNHLIDTTRIGSDRLTYFKRLP
ncbi:diaminohydroxyphosphoribosylaminopyrimidine deaminase/5-amino-6-(5-phosphoribosylamino)uracil reductase [Lewinella antarctica]|uniref:Riboflavin biosynthesis protein RibD n=1 Tax=Neolewinella antarctica TaxID=442734 RepID=A0ABX0XAG9_9BACT|nr:diaminohydroxyphosphoribosylaminopyrimidine deaminase/5-amino-6-(5-phosphoribosylamino)uracil reductase [Neolewinella antarctica]